KSIDLPEKKQVKLIEVEVASRQVEIGGKAQMEAHLPVIALLPNAVLVGSPAAVKDAVLRAKKKMEGNSLAQEPLVQEMRKKVGTVPGLFAYVNMTSPPPLPGADNAPPGIAAIPGLDALVKLVNPKAFRAYAINAGLQKGALHYHEILLLNPK